MNKTALSMGRPLGFSASSPAGWIWKLFQRWSWEADAIEPNSQQGDVSHRLLRCYFMMGLHLWRDQGPPGRSLAPSGEAQFPSALIQWLYVQSAPSWMQSLEPLQASSKEQQRLYWTLGRGDGGVDWNHIFNSKQLKLPIKYSILSRVPLIHLWPKPFGWPPLPQPLFSCNFQILCIIIMQKFICNQTKSSLWTQTHWSAYKIKDLQVLRPSFFRRQISTIITAWDLVP